MTQRGNTMFKRWALYIVSVFIAVCSGAFALQPTIRASSINLNSNTKPTSMGITSTTSTTPSVSSASGSINVSRGSTVSKFAPVVVPVSSTNKSNAVSSSVLDELQQQINDLRSAQLGLEQNQITSDDLDDRIESSVKNLDLTTQNRDLRNALTEIRSTNEGLQSSLDSIQQLTENFTDSLNTDIDNRLKVRGLIDSNNQVSFAHQSDIEPTTLAQRIIASPNATATLADKIQPKESDIRDIITDELTDVGVLSNDGQLDVEKKGQVVVSEETVTNALRNSNNFKTMVSDTVETKGYVTETELNNRDFVTKSALDAKKFITTDSDTFQNLATKSEIAPATIAAAIADNPAATATLSGKVGADEETVNRIFLQGLKDRDILTSAGDLNVARNSDVTAEAIARKIADSDTAKTTLSGQIGTDEDAVKSLITDDLQQRGIIDERENLVIATDSSVSNLSNTVSDLIRTVEGDVRQSGSLLNKISTDATIRGTLASDVTSVLKTDDAFLQSVKGADGKDGSSFNFKGNINTYSELASKEKTQGDAYYNTSDSLLYICSCDANGDNCAFPAINQGVPFKGEKGDPGNNAKPVEQTYCEDNFNIVSALYSDISTIDDCASRFTNARYTAIIGGARAYCLSLIQKVNTLDLTTGIGKKLSNTFTTEKMTALKNTSNVQTRLTMTGFKASDAKTNETFMEACEERYNEIMSGDDGESAKSVEQTYCEAQAENYPTGTKNLALITQLYPTVSSCTDFTAEMYNAIMGGAKAYCLSLATNPAKLTPTAGIGLKLEQALGSGVVSNLKTNKVATRITVSGTEKNFVLACEEKYNEIMSGADGKGYTLKGSVETYANLPTTNNVEGDGWYVKSNGLLYVYRCDSNGTNCAFPAENQGIPFKGDPGQDGETAWYAYCTETDGNGKTNLEKIITPLYSTVTNCDQFTSAQYNAIMGGAKAYCLSLTQDLVAGNVSFEAGIGKKLAKILDDGSTTKLVGLQGKSISTVLNAGSADLRFNNKNIVSACEEKYNEIMSGTDGSDGKSAAETWCEAHLLTNNTVAVRLSPAKMARAYEKIKNISAYATKINTGNGDASGGYFTDMNACLAAVAADPDLMGGESEADQKFNELQAKEIQNFRLDSANQLLTNHRATFRDTYLKGADGAKGADGSDGKTFIPSYNSSTGKIAWTASTSTNPTAADFDVSGAALSAVRKELNDGTATTDSIATLVTNKADSAANTAIANSTTVAKTADVVTTENLIDLIQAGLFQISNGQITLNTDLTTCGNSSLTANQITSVQKLSNKRNFGNMGTCSTGDGSGIGRN